MINKKITFIFVILMIIFAFFSYAEENVGCCTNPASTLVCDDARRADRDTECCPDPEEYPSYYHHFEENPNGPYDYEDCVEDYFFPNQLCSKTSDCTLGCCCELPNPTSTSAGECDVDFFVNETDCATVCATIPECRNSYDDDGDGCIDYYGGDGGCDSPDDDNEDSGEIDCHVGGDCNSVDYQPIISDFEATPIKGERKIVLEWSDECSSKVLRYEVSSCEGANCDDFILISPSTSSSITLESEDILFGQDYRFKVKAFYSTITYRPTAEVSGSLGDIECWNKYDDDTFCIHQSYYDQYEDYLIINYDDISSSNFDSKIEDYFDDKFNSPYHCSENNELISGGESCSDDEVCFVEEGEVECLSDLECNTGGDNPFGLYYTKDGCEGRTYCYYGRSFSSVDNCFSCSPDMACYDYKTEYECSSDICDVRNCEWRELSDELSTGVCINLIKDNCEWCDETGTKGFEGAKAGNKIFEACTPEKAEKLSVDNYKCYFKEGEAKSCSDVICTDYETTDECGKVTLSSDNEVSNTKKDPCGIGVCQMIGGECKKNSEGDLEPDCDTEECEKDHFPPETIMTPIVNAGVYESILIQITDKTSFNGAKSLISSGEYNTYLCKGCTGNHPFSISTSSERLEILGLNVYDSDTRDRILVLSEGDNIIRYYSQDPSKNVGVVKTVQITAFDDTNPRPRTPLVTVTPSNYVGDTYYTSSFKPTITAKFYQDVYITHILLKNTINKQTIRPSFDNQLAREFTFEFLEDLDEGTYILELDAANPGGVYLGQTELVNLVVDASNSTITFYPSEEEVVTKEKVEIIIDFGEPVESPDIFIDDIEYSASFSTEDNQIYSATLNLADGTKNIFVNTVDYAGNNVEGTSYFIINAKEPLVISLKEPTYGVSPEYTFDVVVETDNTAECKYAFSKEKGIASSLSYDFMEDFSSSTGTEHKIDEFNDFPDGSSQEYSLYVMCKDYMFDSYDVDVFNLRVDTSAPEIVTYFADPNPVVENPPETNLRLQTDEETICKYSEDFLGYSLMEEHFLGYDSEDFLITHTQNVSTSDSGEESYYVACENEAGLKSEPVEIKYSIDLTLPLTIEDLTPQYSNTTTIKLKIKTNKKSQCWYSTEDMTGSTGKIFGQESYVHEKTLNLAQGSYTYYVKCKDKYLGAFTDSVPIFFIIDKTVPEMDYVNDSSTLSNPEISWMTDRLRVKWKGHDNNSGINHYLYRLEEYGTLQPIINWTISNVEGEWLWVPTSNNSLSLINGVKYYFKVKARNTVGFLSDVMESDGVTIDIYSEPADCTNNIRDVSETDIDCGGECEPCEEGKHCNEDIDCLTGYCENGVCKSVSCSDGFLQTSNGETDIDCGGDICGSCGEGSKCNIDSDCESDNCEFGRCKADGCNDGLLGPTEADVDCGGVCDTKCEEGKFCNSDTDCITGARCISDKCTTCADDDLDCDGVPDQGKSNDADGDGMDDSWEIRHGLDPNDSSDALSDLDGDELNNLEEYKFGTDPNNPDSDGDRYADKKEIDKGTDPLDPDSKPGTKIWWIILMILIGSLVGLGIFYGYNHFYGSSMRLGDLKIPGFSERPSTPTTPGRRELTPEEIARQIQMRRLRQKREDDEKEKRSKVFDIFDKKEENIKGKEQEDKNFSDEEVYIKKPASKIEEKLTEIAPKKKTIKKLDNKKTEVQRRKEEAFKRLRREVNQEKKRLRKKKK